ncbi:cytochrome c-type biogenesis protein CcmE [Enhygromyxa salina]|uniref:Cytochrome c-type biogenesis protein CcmE n=1 Tax=Enhygromyxa salina TaxID=215803 RepID=A0A2S9XZY7_9BACT|nr:cytochrome c maturation protein CcmE [Enhygromyxa salina]PRP98321.1 cytochrome c-type biogenesis protein CcmE [Enhygromyxa salina]
MALSKGTQIGIGAVVIGAVAFLVFSSPDEGVLEYVYADTVVEAPEDFVDREFKVHGNVVEGTLSQDDDDDTYHFVIEFKGKRLKVVYDNLLPDTFVEGGEVVLTGHLDPDSMVIRSSEMTAKCPSKYEEEPGAPQRT